MLATGRNHRTCRAISFVNFMNFYEKQLKDSLRVTYLIEQPRVQKNKMARSNDFPLSHGHGHGHDK